MKIIILTDGLIDVEEGVVRENVAIYLQDNRIEKIVDADQVLMRELAEETIIDGKNKYVIPGLIDSHLHLNFSADANPLGAFLGADHEKLYEISLANCRRAIQAGITTVRDCGSVGEVVLRLKKESEEGRIAAPRILTSGEAITTRGGHIYFVGKQADTAEEMKQAAAELIASGVDFIKLVISGGNMTPGSSDLKDQYTLEQIQELTDFVHRMGRKVMAHVHTREGFTMALDGGVDYLEHGSWRVEGGIQIDEEEIDRMFAREVVYCTALPKSYTVNFEKPHQDRVRATISNMKHKTNVVLGTDGGTPNNGVEELVNQAVFLGERGGFTNAEMLRMMTLQPGRLITGEKIGEIREGYEADLVILNQNPLENLENLKDIKTVIKAGRILKLC